MSIRGDLIQQQESRTKTVSRSIRLMSLPLFLLIILATSNFIREKLVALDSVRELESQVKRTNDDDQFTFFYTLPDLKMKSVPHDRIRTATVTHQDQKPAATPPVKDRSLPKADNKTERAVNPAPGEGYTIQVAALRMQDEAEKIIQSLRTRGYSAYLVKDDPKSQEGPWYRVRIGRFSVRPEAEKHLHELRENAGVMGFVTAFMKKSAGL